MINHRQVYIIRPAPDSKGENSMKLIIEYELENREASRYTHNDDVEKVKKQTIPADIILDKFSEIAKDVRANFIGGVCENVMLLMSRAYNLGVIHGKRMERIRKQGKKTRIHNCITLETVSRAVQIVNFFEEQHTDSERMEFVKKITRGLTDKEISVMGEMFREVLRKRCKGLEV